MPANINTFNNQETGGVLKADSEYASSTYRVVMGSASGEDNTNKGKFWVQGKATIEYSGISYPTDITKGISNHKPDPRNGNYTFFEIKDVVLQDNESSPIKLVQKK